MAETSSLLNCRTGYSVPRVRISSPPLQTTASRLSFLRLIQGALPPHTPPPLRARSLCSYDTAQFAKTRPPRAACRRLDKPNTLVLHHSDTVRAVLVSNRVFLQHSDTVRAVLVSNLVFLQHSDTVRAVLVSNHVFLRHLDTVRVVLASRTSRRIVSSGLYIATSPTSTVGCTCNCRLFCACCVFVSFSRLRAP